MSGTMFERKLHHRYGDERCSNCGFTEERAKKECCTADCPMKREPRATPEELEARYAHLMPWLSR